MLALAVMLGSFCFISCEAEKEVLEGDLVLSVSSDMLIANGTDELVFTAMVGDIDVTEEATLYVNNKQMSGNHFSTEQAGSYKFFASYEGKLSNYIAINAANPALYVELPEDSQIDKFSDFQRKVLITEGTGTWCGYCPYMITALELFSEYGSNADKAVIVAMHSGDEFGNAASDAAVSACRITGFPSCVFNLNPDALLENNDPNVNAENLNTMVAMELMETARVGIAAATAVNADSSVIGVRAAVKVGKDGKYRINAWLIEDGVPASQSSYWYEFSDGKSAIVIDHMHILRGASCVSPIQGQLLGDKGDCAAGDMLEYYHEFDAAKAGIADVANCKVVVMVAATSGSSSKFFVNNIIECPINESIPFAYNN